MISSILSIRCMCQGHISEKSHESQCLHQDLKATQFHCIDSQIIQ